MFISFEGPEGSGKSTQIDILARNLKKKGIDFICIREPGGTLLSEKIRDILKSNSYNDLTVQSELLLFLASRSQLVNKVIKPALKINKYVLCDRYIDSTLAYQGYGRNIPIESIKLLNSFATGGLEPDITFLLQLDVDTGFRRIKKRYEEKTGTFDRIEMEDKSFHQRVFDGYNKIASSNNRIITINANEDIDFITNKIQSEIDKLVCY